MDSAEQIFFRKLLRVRHDPNSILENSNHVQSAALSLPQKANDVHAFQRSKADFIESYKLLSQSFRKIIRDLVILLETKRKVVKHKKVIENLIVTWKSYTSWDFNFLEEITNLPLFYQSRWDILSVLINKLPELFIQKAESLKIADELLACAADQDCAARCSSFIVALAKSNIAFTHPNLNDILLTALCSPESATRSNVMRSWFSRIISFKSVEEIIRNLIDSLIEKADAKINQEFDSRGMKNRLVRGITCVDLDWSSKFTADINPTSHIALHSLLSCYKAMYSGGSQIRLDVALIKLLLYEATDSFDDDVRSLASLVGEATGQKTKNYATRSQPFEASGGETFEGFLYEEVDVGHSGRVPNRQSNKIKGPKSYPISESGRFKYEEKLDTFENAEISLNQILEVQGAAEYPSVSSVMDTLKNKNIDERSYAEKLVNIMDSVQGKFIDKHPEWIDNAAPFLFKVLSRCPLRTVVDHGGMIVKQLAKENYKFREKIFNCSIELLSEEGENTRPLTFEHCLVGTVAGDRQRVARVWEIVKKMKSKKKRFIVEMLANIVASSTTELMAGTLNDMILCSLRLVDDALNCGSIQLLAACVPKLLGTHHEVDRAILFVVAQQRSEIFELITKILDQPPSSFNEQSYMLVLHFFSRLSIGDVNFYDDEKKKVVERMQRFVEYVMLTFSNDQILVSSCVDAFCAIQSWGDVKRIGDRKMIEKKDANQKLEIEKLIADNLHHYHYWNLFKNAWQEDHFVSYERLAELPGGKFIAEMMSFEQLSEESLEKFNLFMNDAKLKDLRYHEKNALSFLICYQSWLWTKLTPQFELHREYYLLLIDSINFFGDIIGAEVAENLPWRSWLTLARRYLQQNISYRRVTEETELVFRSLNIGNRGSMEIIDLDDY